MVAKQPMSERGGTYPPRGGGGVLRVRRPTIWSRRLGRYFGQQIEDGPHPCLDPHRAETARRSALTVRDGLGVGIFAALDAGEARYGRTLFDKRMMPASIDIAMGFSRPFAPTNGAYVQDSPSAQDGRALREA